MFKRYMHIERYGSDAVQGIELGKVFVFPKLDGTNSSVWMEANESTDYLCAGSRNREISHERDNANFMSSLLIPNNDVHKTFTYSELGLKLLNFFQEYPHLRFYGEWLVPHTLKTYRDDAWNKFYVFDVYDDQQEVFLDYRYYSKLLDRYGIDYIPCMAEMNNASYDQLLKNLQNNTFLIEDGKGIGEGVVIKNYEFVNRFGNVVWAKMVNNEFKAANHKAFGHPVIGSELIEEKIVSLYVPEIAKKTYAKICNDNYGWNSKQIPRLLEQTFHDLITEDLYDSFKKTGLKTINFSTLKGLTIQTIKQTLPELF